MDDEGVVRTELSLNDEAGQTKLGWLSGQIELGWRNGCQNRLSSDGGADVRKD